MTQNTLSDEIDKIIYDEANLSLQPLLYLASDEKLDNWNEAATGVYRQVYKICRSIAEKTVEAVRVEPIETAERITMEYANITGRDETMRAFVREACIQVLTEQSKKAKEWLGE